jgi:hypothetical protein
VAQVNCIVREGDLPLTISWSFHGRSLNSTMGISSSVMGISTMQMGARTKILMIDAVTAAHSGTYRCLAKNDVGEDEYLADLRVSG